MPNTFIVDSAGGISGSLQHLVDGTSYLIAGDHISIVSQSNGSVLISLSGSLSIANINVSGSALGLYTAPPVPQASAVVPVAAADAMIDCTSVWNSSGDPAGRNAIDTNFSVLASKVSELRTKLNQVLSVMSQVSGGIGITQ